MLLSDCRIRVVLVDNSSPGDDAERLASWLRSVSGVPRDDDVQRRWLIPTAYNYSENGNFEILYVPSDVNGGFAAGCNIAINLARTDPRYEYVWLLNNDTLVNSSSLTEMLSRFSHEDNVGMCGSTLVYYDKPDIVQGCGGYFNIALGRGRAIGAFERVDNLPAVSAVESSMNYVIGASLLVSKKCLESVGLLDERYFLYFEELDWAVRAKKLGFKLAWSAKSIVIHKEGSAVGSAQRGRPSNLSLYFMTVNYLRFILARRPILLPIAIVRTLVNAGKWAARQDWQAVKITLTGLSDFSLRPLSSSGQQEVKRFTAIRPFGKL